MRTHPNSLRHQDPLEKINSNCIFVYIFCKIPTIFLFIYDILNEVLTPSVCLTRSIVSFTYAMTILFGIIKGQLKICT